MGLIDQTESDSKQVWRQHQIYIGVNGEESAPFQAASSHPFNLSITVAS
jgi:hypothetical protein